MYFLFSIFDIYILVLYSEGKQKVLKRLRDKIYKDYLYLARLWSVKLHNLRVNKERIEEVKGGLISDAYC